jgi:hypothetical protein
LAFVQGHRAARGLNRNFVIQYQDAVHGVNLATNEQ